MSKPKHASTTGTKTKAWTINTIGLTLGCLVSYGSAFAFPGDAMHWMRLNVSSNLINPLAKCGNGESPTVLIKNVFNPNGTAKTSNANKVLIHVEGGGDFRGDPNDWNLFWNNPTLAGKLKPTRGIRPDSGIFDYTDPAKNVFFAEDYRIIWFDECASDGWMGAGTRVAASAASISNGAPSGGFYASGQIILNAGIDELKTISASNLNVSLRGIGNLVDSPSTRIVIVGNSTGGYGVLGNLARLKMVKFPLSDVRAIVDSYFPVDTFDWANEPSAIAANFRPNSDTSVMDARKALASSICVSTQGYPYLATHDCVDAAKAIKQILAIGIPVLFQHNLRDKIVLNQTENFGLGGICSLFYCTQLTQGGPAYGYCNPARVSNPSSINFVAIRAYPERYTDTATMEQKVWDSILGPVQGPRLDYAPRSIFISRQVSGQHTVTAGRWYYDWKIVRSPGDEWSFADMVRNFVGTSQVPPVNNYVLGQLPGTGATYSAYTP